MRKKLFSNQVLRTYSSSFTHKRQVIKESTENFYSKQNNQRGRHLNHLNFEDMMEFRDFEKYEG